MDDDRTYRTRRIALGLSAVALIVLAQHEAPRFGTVRVTMDGAKAPRVEAALAPPLDAIAALVITTVDRLAD